MEEKTLVTTIKSSLPGVVKLAGDSRQAFEAFVEDQVRVTSVRLRRASLVLLYHLTRMAQAGQRIPNLFMADTTYWKNAVELHPARLPIDLVGTSHLSEVEALVGPAPSFDRNRYLEVPAADDQILSYAATTFSTVVCNNAWVPLVPRLTRLAKFTIRHHRIPRQPSALTTADLVAALRSTAQELDGLPEWASAFVVEVRRRLRLETGTFLFDNYGKTLDFHDVLFNFWMQQRFISLGVKRTSLSPVFRVGRVHVRLDKKILVNFVRANCPDHPSVAKMLALEKQETEPTSNPDCLLPPRPVKGRVVPSRECPSSIEADEEEPSEFRVRLRINVLKAGTKGEPRRLVGALLRVVSAPKPKVTNSRPDPLVALSIKVAPQVSLKITKARLSKKCQDPLRVRGRGPSGPGQAGLRQPRQGRGDAGSGRSRGARG